MKLTKCVWSVDQAKYSKAAKAELNRDLDVAFRLYISAAEDFLHLSRTTADPKVRSACKADAAKSLERAERIKGVQKDLTPVVKDHFSQRMISYLVFTGINEFIYVSPFL